MELTGGAERRARGDHAARACEARIDLTITDEDPLAQAFVIISAVAVSGGAAILHGGRAHGAARGGNENSSCLRAGAKLMTLLGKRDGRSCDQVSRAIACVGVRGYKVAAGR